MPYINWVRNKLNVPFTVHQSGILLKNATAARLDVKSFR